PVRISRNSCFGRSNWRVSPIAVLSADIGSFLLRPALCSFQRSVGRNHHDPGTPRVQSVAECTLEVEGRRGKLRIQLKGASASDLASLSRVLWENGRSEE